MDCSQRDYFELIGAFLDGETSPEESRQVRQLLAEDPQARQVYQRLQVLRRGLRNLPLPEPALSSESLANRVFAADDRRRHRRALWWGGGAIAALFVAMLSMGDLLPLRPGIFQLADEKSSTSAEDALLVRINEPIVAIPEVAPTAEP